MVLSLPFSVVLPRKAKADKVFMLNLNVYRNTHYMILNKAKVAWKDIVWAAYHGAGRSVPPFPWRFAYTAFPLSRRSFDLGNVLSIVQKFTDDALIDLLVIPDDSYRYIKEVDYRFGYVDKVNPRVELTIEEIGFEEIKP